MSEQPVIDHNPNEKPRPTRGEAIFVAIITTGSLIGMALLYDWVWDKFGIGVGAAFIMSVSATLLAIACWQEWKKRRRLW